MTTAAKKMDREGATIAAMIDIYCRELHGRPGGLCPDCGALLAYARGRIARCPWGENKPACAQCTIHCYERSMREEVIKVMRHAGPKMLYRHPLLALCHLIIRARSRNYFSKTFQPRKEQNLTADR
jgi:hypothetical protein